MFKRKMSLSIAALTSAVLLFIGATFAWLTLSDIVHLGGTEVAVEDVEATAVLETSADGVSGWTSTSAIAIANAVPGDVFYYRLVITNVGAKPIDTAVAFIGFSNSVADILGDDANFQAGRSLAAVLLYSMTNTANTDTITDQPIQTLAGGPVTSASQFYGATNLDIAVSDSETVYFSLSIAETMGNDYQNLKLTIDLISVQSIADEG
ncbi:MAG: hypothetical protein WC509_08755 [Candidatus Izemoplasmatales bacterium]